MTYELAAIWMNRTVGKYHNGAFIKTNRIAPGDEVIIKDNAVQYGSQDTKPNHIIVACFQERHANVLMVIDKVSFYPRIINSNKEPNLI